MRGSTVVQKKPHITFFQTKTGLANSHVYCLIKRIFFIDTGKGNGKEMHRIEFHGPPSVPSLVPDLVAPEVSLDLPLLTSGRRINLAHTSKVRKTRNQLNLIFSINALFDYIIYNHVSPLQAVKNN